MLTKNKAAIPALEKTSWDVFLQNNNHARIFHTAMMYEVYQHSRGVQPILVIETDASNNILGLALGEKTTLLFPCFGYTDRLAFYAAPLFNGDIQVLGALLQKIKTLSRFLLIEIRLHEKLSDAEKKVYADHGFVWHDHLNAIVPISSADQLWSALAEDKQKGIEAARANKIVIKEMNTLEGIDIFYTLVSSLYKQKHRPLKGKDYFVSLLRSGHFHFLNAFYNEQPIATQLYYQYNSIITAYYTASDPTYANKHAGDLLLWELIERSMAVSAPYLDLGGGGKPYKPYGVREYKKRFNAQFENTGRFVATTPLLRPLINKLYRLY